MSATDILDLVGVVPLLPLLGAVILVLFGRRIGEPAAGWLATTMLALSFVWSIVTFFALSDLPEHARSYTVNLFTFLQSGGLDVKFGFLVDPLSVTFILFVTGIATLIHIFSVGYMHGDELFSRFFAYLNLFVASMLLLVLGSSFLVTFIGWEGVGLCSYLLIGFWFERRGASVASKKAFVTTRVGDLGFLIAMFLIFQQVGTLDYSHLGAAAEVSSGVATTVALLLFLGAIGKSAQFPLHVWLPDAMEGPTPVSALIHAATMVTAGVFLIARAHPWFEASSDAMTVVAWIGGLTALLAGTVALVQPDIKRVLAYSTISQLGYMFLALGVGAYIAAIFHVITHAFFKGNLFLGAGSVIHGNGDNQDMRVMGRMRKLMPITSAAMIVATFAIMGIPPFAGFWSKDEILLQSFLADEYALWVIALAAALLTAVYMTRLMLMTFGGNARWEDAPAHVDPGAAALPVVAGGSDDDTLTLPPLEPEFDPTEPTVAYGSPPRTPGASAGHPPHESPWVMTGPVVVLAILSLIGGFIFIPLRGLEFLSDWLEPAFSGVEAHHPDTFVGGFALSLLAVVIALIGIAIAFALYRRGLRTPAEDPLVERLGAAAPVFGNAYYFDAVIGDTFAERGPGRRFAEWLTSFFDARVIDGAVNGVAAVVRFAAMGLRRLQNGLVRSYALVFAAGVALLLLFLLLYAGR